MNTHSGGQWRFRLGKKILMKSLGGNLPGASMIPGGLFRRAPILGPVLAWIVGIAVHDLKQPQSRIKAFARRMLEKRGAPVHVKAEVVGPAAINGPEPQGTKALEKLKNDEET